MRFLFLTFLILSCAVEVNAQESWLWENDETIANRMDIQQQVTDNLQNQQNDYLAADNEKKSVGKAVLFSLVVPGAGQFYSESYIKSAVFLAAEIGAWAVNIAYNNKGDDKDAEFKQFANAHWSEHAYWSYVVFKADATMNIPINPEDLILTQTNSGGTWYLIPENQYTPENIAALREIEKKMTTFTHRLPKTKTQQYYEMIGKYPVQFGASWDDANFNSSYRGPDRITTHNNTYQDMRDESNRMYDIAGYGAMAVLVNHVVSAIDAGFTARRFNRRHAYLEMSYKNHPYKSEYLNMFGVNIKW